MCRYPAAATVAVVALAASCAAPQHEQGWPRLRTGMSHADVEALLGSPSSRYVPPPPPPERSSASLGSRGERWQYGDSLSSFATRAVFPDEADERAWCVFFGPDGTVSGFRPPRWAAGFAEKDPRPPARPAPPSTVH